MNTTPTPQAAESAAVFTHQIAGPTEEDSHAHHFCRLVADYNVVVRKSAPGFASLLLFIYGDEYATASKKLNADQCEALARNLVDAAHHLRTTAGGAQ